MLKFAKLLIIASVLVVVAAPPVWAGKTRNVILVIADAALRGP